MICRNDYTKKLKITIQIIKRSYFNKKSYFKVPKDVTLNSTHFFIMKIPNKRELQQIALNYSSDTSLKILLKFIKNALQNHILF